ncbi:MAG: DUF721 domain-containing protein [Kiritimatiellae bacterium]|nr:DUF721 domain-containing protein [Kiritimatiellia bacterium]
MFLADGEASPAPEKQGSVFPGRVAVSLRNDPLFGVAFMSKGRKRKYDKGWWITQQDRFQITGRYPPLPFCERPIASVLPDVLQRMDMKQDAWLLRISEVWRTLAVDSVATFARPALFENGYLTVYVKHSAYLQELSRYGKSQLLKNLQDHFGANQIRQIVLRLEPDPAAESNGAYHG